MSDSHAPAGAETRNSIRTFVRRRFPLVVSAGLGDGDSLLDAGIVDSLGILDMVAYLEETFGVQIGDEDLNPENFESIESVTRFVDGRLGARP